MRDINPGAHTMRGRHNNCGDCARAAERTWRGQRTVASPNRQIGGDKVRLMAHWAWGGDIVSTTFERTHGHLARLGPGSSAIIFATRRGVGGHWFNAFNFNGGVLACDAQIGRVEAWPPTRHGLGFDQTDAKNVLALFIDPHGYPLGKDVLK